jgi:hypothetical protein
MRVTRHVGEALVFGSCGKGSRSAVEGGWGDPGAVTWMV